VEFYLNARKPKAITKKRMIYNYKKADFDALRENLDKVPWECVLMERSIEINWTNWKDVFDMAVEECVPKVVWKPHKAKNWLSEETLSTIKKKRRLYRRAKKTRRRKDLRKFRCISNTVRELTRRDHITHTEQMAEEDSKNHSGGG